jgi:hypothetical protein
MRIDERDMRDPCAVEYCRERVKRDAAHSLHEQLVSGKTIVVRLDMEERAERLPYCQGMEIRGRLTAMDVPRDWLKPTEYVSREPIRVVQRTIEVERPIQNRSAADILTGLGKRFVRFLRDTAKEVEYDGPRG